jgi:transcriptional antiterminator
MEDFKILKTKKITSINNCIQNMQKDISVLQVVKGDNSNDFFVEFYQRHTKILKMEKLVMAVDNNPLLISKIHAKYQKCFSDGIYIC